LLGCLTNESDTVMALTDSYTYTARAGTYASRVYVYATDCVCMMRARSVVITLHDHGTWGSYTHG
jgi:hypothetical protein